MNNVKIANELKAIASLIEGGEVKTASLSWFKDVKVSNPKNSWKPVFVYNKDMEKFYEDFYKFIKKMVADSDDTAVVSFFDRHADNHLTFSKKNKVDAFEGFTHEFYTKLDNQGKKELEAFDKKNNPQGKLERELYKQFHNTFGDGSRSADYLYLKDGYTLKILSNASDVVFAVGNTVVWELTQAGSSKNVKLKSSGVKHLSYLIKEIENDKYDLYDPID